jgi:crossover junction endodeoxyribonuclease RuvC
MRILGIDPGYERVGIAILEKNPGQKKETVLYSDCFKTSPKLPHNGRLLLIGIEVKRIIEKYNPETIAVEKLFFNDNQKTAMLVSEARGVIVYEASQKALAVCEYTPLEVKMAITGYGRGTKNQVIEMVKKLAVMDKKTESDDEFDAIAIALTCFAINPKRKA